MVKAGIIGGGVVSDGHVQALKDDGRVELIGVADPSQAARDRMASEYGVATFPEHQKIIEMADVVYICTPHVFHLPMAAEAIAAGKHVVCEKPFAMNAAEAEEMVVTARRAGVKIFVAENFRYIPEIIKMREIIASGEIGSPFLCLSCFIGDEFARMSDSANWKGTKATAGGGVIIDNGPHMLDSLYHLFGKVDEISATAGRLVVEANNKEEDSAQINIRFTNGVLVNCALTFAAVYNGFPDGYMGFGVRYDINATSGALHAVVGRELVVMRGREQERLASRELPRSSNMDSDFIGAILGEAEPLVTGDDGLYVMRMVDACYKSIAEARAVRLVSGN
jgi:predicted dehydrogenase